MCQRDEGTSSYRIRVPTDTLHCCVNYFSTARKYCKIRSASAELIKHKENSILQCMFQS